MPADLSKSLVIGISSRALFNLEESNAVFEKNGEVAYGKLQHAFEDQIFKAATAASKFKFRTFPKCQIPTCRFNRAPKKTSASLSVFGKLFGPYTEQFPLTQDADPWNLHPPSSSCYSNSHPSSPIPPSTPSP
ncbi:5'-nucleotidase [Singulisphaera sp. GP187]|uniref:5'-nucleotidase n=1 Tax=Singulisphaera sp. GP187 TaxID=1882752 RepID=UPI003965883C